MTANVRGNESQQGVWRYHPLTRRFELFCEGGGNSCPPRFRGKYIAADRRDPKVIAPLRTLVLQSKDDALALQALWALYVSGGFDEPLAARLLDHHNTPLLRRNMLGIGEQCQKSGIHCRVRRE